MQTKLYRSCPHHVIGWVGQLWSVSTTQKYFSLTTVSTTKIRVNRPAELLDVSTIMYPGGGCVVARGKSGGN